VQHKKSPITGEPMTTKDILRLNMAKNTSGNWHCPVTFKVILIPCDTVSSRRSADVWLESLEKCLHKSLC
jgi:peptidyl-prolyl cis-trans isomerase-like protein 2